MLSAICCGESFRHLCFYKQFAVSDKMHGKRQVLPPQTGKLALIQIKSLIFIEEMFTEHRRKVNRNLGLEEVPENCYKFNGAPGILTENHLQ